MCVGDPVPCCVIPGIFSNLFFERSERLGGRCAETILRRRENKKKRRYKKLRVIHGAQSVGGQRRVCFQRIAAVSGQPTQAKSARPINDFPRSFISLDSLAEKEATS